MPASRHLVPVIDIAANIPARPPTRRRPAPEEWLDVRPAQRRRTAQRAPSSVASDPVPSRYNLRPRPARIAPELQRSALRGYSRTHRFPGADVDLQTFLAHIRPHVYLLLTAALRRNQGVKAHLVVIVEMDKQSAHGTETQTMDLRCNAYSISNRGQVNKTVKLMERDVELQLEVTSGVGSGWNFKRVDHAWLNTIVWQPLAGGCITPTCALPKKIAEKQACISIAVDKDSRWKDRCFELSLSSWKHPPRDHPQRLKWYDEFYGEWNMQGISAPVALHDVDRFEKQNGVRINVYGLDTQDNVYPLQMSSYSPERTDLPECDLLLYTSPDGPGHYVWIVNLLRLLRKSGSHDLYCPRCLQHWKVKTLYDSHMAGNCRDIEAIRTIMPAEDKAVLHFKAVKNTLQAPFFVVAELEMATDEWGAYQLSGFGLYVVCTFKPELSYYHTHSAEGASAGEQFIAALLQARELADEHLRHNEPMKLSAEEDKQYQAVTHCWICRKPGFATAAQIKHNKSLAAKLRVRDHCQFTGRFRGAAHTGCNWSLNWKSWKLPVLMRGLKLQSHVIIQQLHEKLRDVRCIASNSQQLISFGFNRIRFVDASRFLAETKTPVGAPLRERVSHLTDAWKSFAALCMREDGLDPSHYVSVCRPTRSTALSRCGQTAERSLSTSSHSRTCTRSSRPAYAAASVTLPDATPRPTTSTCPPATTHPSPVTRTCCTLMLPPSTRPACRRRCRRATTSGKNQPSGARERIMAVSESDARGVPSFK